MKIWGILLLLVFLTVFSCKKDNFYTSENVNLKFSVDTVSFDTLFSGFGSITKRLMVYNPYNEPIRISSVSLAGNDQSPFILNVNGTGKQANNVIIEAKDSLYIFIQLFMQSTGSDLPVFVKDSVIFTTNGRQQNVKLIAYEQDANLLKDSTITTQTWSGSKPYLIYGDLILDSANTLYINPGVHIFFHRDANFIVKGNIQATGTFNDPIIFRHDRFDDDYKDIPGQWGGIYVYPGVGSHKLDWVIIENGTTGLQLGSDSLTQGTTIDLSNVIIQNMSFACLLSYNSAIYGTNCLIANSREYTCWFLGGRYEFTHSTLANYYDKYDNRKSNYPLLQISNYRKNETGSFDFFDLESSFFHNCIIYGSNSDELKHDFKTDSQSNIDISYDYCLIRKYNSSGINSANKVIWWNKDPKFMDGAELNFELDTLSPAIDMGDQGYGISVPYDLKNISRMNDKAPDLGAFERKEKGK